MDSRPIEDNNAIPPPPDVRCLRQTLYDSTKSGDDPLIVIKKKRYEPRAKYDRSKIETGILRACHKRPVSAEKINEMVNKVETELFSGEEH